MSRQTKFRWSLAIGLVLMALVVGALQVRYGVAVAAPAPAPTPISEVAGGENWVMVTWLNTNTIDVDVASTGIHMPAYTVADIQHVLDVGSAQTATCYLDFSNDNSNWDRGPTIINAKLADETDMNQYNLFGRYSRITCTLTTANEVTITVRGKVHN